MPLRDRSNPALALPSGLKAAVAVRFCPVLFKRKLSGTQPEGGAAPPSSGLPYRMVLAVATMDSIMLYETEVGGLGASNSGRGSMASPWLLTKAPPLCPEPSLLPADIRPAWPDGWAAPGGHH